MLNAKGEAAGTNFKIKQSYLRSPRPACYTLIYAEHGQFQ
jgi:hypothetical protein